MPRINKKSDSIISKGQGKRLGLLICNGTFPGIPEANLTGPAKDAKILESVLSDKEIGQFKIKTLLDRGLLEVRRSIAQICSEVKSGDTLLIYYSGNGLAEKGQSLYLLVNDSDRKFLDATTLDAEFILSQLRKSECQKIILVDTCYAGAFFNQNRGIPNGLFAITSCGEEERCSDTAEGGAFTLALCAALRGSAADTDGDGRVSIDELHEFIKQWLLEHYFTGTPQKWVWDVPEPIYVSNVQRPVFLCYSRDDTNEADRLTKALESEGLSVWIDRTGIQAGVWKEKIMKGLKNSRVLLFLLSEKSLNSQVVKKELDFAASKNVQIIPVQIGVKAVINFPDWFIMDFDSLHRHIINPEQYQEGIKRLVTAIRQIHK